MSIWLGYYPSLIAGQENRIKSIGSSIHNFNCLVV